MKKKPSKRKPAAIVVGRTNDRWFWMCVGQTAVIDSYDELKTKEGVATTYVSLEAARKLKIRGLKPGQYVRFVQDGGVRKARRVR